MIDEDLCTVTDKWLYCRYPNGEEIIGIGNIFATTTEASYVYSSTQGVRVKKYGDLYNRGSLTTLRLAEDADFTIFFVKYPQYINVGKELIIKIFEMIENERY